MDKRSRSEQGRQPDERRRQTARAAGRRTGDRGRRDERLWDPTETSRERRKQDERRLETETSRREVEAAVDLYAIDKAYAKSASNGMADARGKSRAVDAAVEEAAAKRSGGGGDRTARPTQRDRARAAQRWEQNREYVEDLHERREQK